MTLVEFYMGFSTALETQRNNRVQLCEDSRNSSPELKTELLMEKHASEEFTNAAFFDIQREIKAAVYRCSIEAISEDVSNKNYTVYDKDCNSGRLKVTFSPSTEHASCSCKLFESTGILCRHVFHILSALDFSDIPSCLVPKRWRKDTLFNKENDFTFAGRSISREASKLMSQIWLEMRSVMANAEYEVPQLRRLLEFVKRSNEECSISVSQADNTNKVAYFEKAIGIPQPSEVIIKPPEIARNKGCGRRMKSTREVMSENNKKRKRQCKACKQYCNHDSRNCPNKNSPQQADVADNSDTPADKDHTDEEQSE